MNPMDDELKKSLANGPLIRNGFSEKLKKRIEDRLEQKHNNTRKSMLVFGCVSTMLIAASIFFMVDGVPSVGHDEIVVHQREMTAFETEAALPTTKDQSVYGVRSAVLVGLREDHPTAGSSPAHSTYRTLLLAPEGGKLRTAAEGDGILMPYKMGFVRIAPDSQLNAANEESHTLQVMAAADRVLPQVQAYPSNTKSLKVAEKLLFAGNRYVALSQSIRQLDQGKPSVYEYAWVKEVDELTSSKINSTGIIRPLQDPHTTLKRLYGESIQPSLKLLNTRAPQNPGPRTSSTEQEDDNGESWTIVRKNGEWTPQVASYTERAADNGYEYQLKPLSYRLPESVVSYDLLPLSWEEIRKLQPNAKDAFASPNKEIVGVISNDSINMYPYDGKLIPKPLLTIKLASDESIVMLQWAVNEPYIEQWKQKGKLLLGEN
ncbi:hypothetical protein SAMN03159341_101222 [Paenibacillus sp. 1_12]|uniref:hypothetical protein n=1 Tax=Paenibacillus sp. 1_12 TaxID=1566278 RepID=UPI0008E292DF|nr:hypothetical protein [Paenibacillus sp. 1_12]SFK71395.1 hypothetical protein SAMN03159341_101222 [Paenibacillus sp. 1_12]